MNRKESGWIVSLLDLLQLPSITAAVSGRKVIAALANAEGGNYGTM